MADEKQFEFERVTRRRLIERAALVGAGAVLTPNVLGLIDRAGAAVVATPRRGGHLRTGHVGGGATESIVPLITENYIDNARFQQLYEMLFFPRPNLTIEPRLAVSVEARNRTSTVWLLKLRQGVTFHDGKPFTADDVLYTWRWVLNPKNKATNQSTLTPIDIRKTRKLSAHEIEIHLKFPVGDMEGLLANADNYIIPNGMTNFPKPNGTGPFKFVSFTRGVQSEFTRNDNYWGSGPYVDEVTMHSIPDATARLNALLGGQIDAMETMNAVQAKAQTKSKSIRVLKIASPSAVPFTMRMDTKPFTDNRVRLAFKYAVDRHQLLSSALQGFGSIGNDLFGKGYPSFNSSLPPRPYDPERAKSLLKKAGFQPLDIVLYTSNGVVAGAYEAATAFVQQAKPAGINVTLRQIPPDQYFNTANKYMSPSAPFYESSWPYSFQEQAVQGLLPNAPFKGETQWWKSNPKWVTDFRKAQGISDTAKRNARYRELQVPLYEQGGYVVWGYQDLLDAVGAKLRGVVPHPLYPLGYYEFKDWWFAS